MRIGIVSNATRFARGGPAITVSNLANTFLANGHEVHTICWPAGKLYGHPVQAICHFARVFATILLRRCDVVSVHNCFVGLAAAYVARVFVRCKICFSLHTVPMAESVNAGMRLGFLRDDRCPLLLLKEADLVTAVSQFVVDRFREIGWTSLPEIAIVPSGVDVERQVPTEQNPDPASPHSTLRLLSVGVLAWPWKVQGHIRALRCLATCRHSLGEFELSIAGGGPLRGELEVEVQKLRLQSNVRLLGSVGDMGSHFSRADAYLHFAENEGCSLALLEALSHGLPIVASGKGGNGFVLQGLEGVLLLDGTEAEVVEQIGRAHV